MSNQVQRISRPIFTEVRKNAFSKNGHCWCQNKNNNIVDINTIHRATLMYTISAHFG